MNTHGFALVREQEVPELNSRALLYRHVATGAELLSIENDDENKVFGITFRTPPSDSTGVAHILEHITLCGSRKYPLKDPFVELIKGSLKTFLNAFTYPDKTCYPVASQNTQDFYNLVDVYLDAVFFPRIARHHFEQEGWHYELEDAAQPLAYKGVVYNEMKGAYSSPDSMLHRYVQQSLFPDTTYGVDSGGDPAHIPDLTYEQLKGFHDTFYHPSNARIFFYGNDDPAHRFALLAEYLDAFQPIEVPSDVPLQPSFAAPRTVERTYAASAADADASKAMVAISWKLGEVSDLTETLGLVVLDHMLLGTPAAPLRKALIDSGLGENVVGGGLGDSLRELTFSTGLKNTDPQRVAEIEQLVLGTLRALADGGIAQGEVDAAMNTVEFSLRENNTGSFPRGISLMLGALGGWLYGRDPIDQISFEAPLAALKQAIAADAPAYFGALIQRYFLDNPHRTTVVLKADPALGERLAAQERARLDAAQAALSEQAAQAIVLRTAELKELQERPDPPEVRATIPSLGIADLDRQVRSIPIEVLDGAVKLIYHDIFANGIVYLDLGFDLRTLAPELLPYLPLFGRSLLEMGTKREDYVQLSQRIGRSTGGIHVDRLVSTRRGDRGSAAWLLLRGKAMPEHVGELLAIMRDVITGVNLDNRERFRQMALQEKTRFESSLVPSGHSFADARLRARFSEADWAGEQMGGISYLLFVRQLIQRIDSDWEGVCATLQQIRDTLLNRAAMLCNITADHASWLQVRPQIDAALSELPSSPVSHAPWPQGLDQPDEGLLIPAQVNYVAKGGSLTAAGFAPSGAVAVVSNYLRTAYLWEQVRVRGGAYGGFSRYDRLTGVWSMLSYRDPNLLRTLDVYDGTGAFLRGLDLSETELTRSIIGTISDLDAYQLPDAKGYTSLVRYLIGETDELRQIYRDQVLGTTLADFHKMGQALDVLSQRASVVAIGGQAAVEQANAERPGLLHVEQVL
ncbi:peptidase M16 [Chloroflexia bacterium SDU3-3]|nr:peptidase M16 [Chloroflexia bacterium SDU3-3]